MEDLMPSISSVRKHDLKPAFRCLRQTAGYRPKSFMSNGELCEGWVTSNYLIHSYDRMSKHSETKVIANNRKQLLLEGNGLTQL